MLFPPGHLGQFCIIVAEQNGHFGVVIPWFWFVLLVSCPVALSCSVCIYESRSYDLSWLVVVYSMESWPINGSFLPHMHDYTQHFISTTFWHYQGWSVCLSGVLSWIYSSEWSPQQMLFTSPMSCLLPNPPLYTIPSKQFCSLSASVHLPIWSEVDLAIIRLDGQSLLWQPASKGQHSQPHSYCMLGIIHWNAGLRKISPQVSNIHYTILTCRITNKVRVWSRLNSDTIALNLSVMSSNPDPISAWSTYQSSAEWTW